MREFSTQNSIEPKKALFLIGEGFVDEFYHVSLLNSLAKYFELSVSNIFDENHKMFLRNGFNSFYQHHKILRSVSPSRIDEYEDKYDVSFTWLAYIFHRYYRLPLKICTKILLKYFIIFEEFLEENKPDYIITGIGGELNKMAVITLAEKMNIPIIFHGQSLISKECFFLQDNIDGTIAELGEKVPVLKDFVLQQDKILSEERFSRKGVDSLTRIIGKISRILHLIIKGELVLLWSGLYFNLLRIYGFINISIFNMFSSNLNGLKKIDKKLLFFPMHVGDDSQITYINSFFSNQYYLVKHLLKFLRNDMVLVIKSHPASPSYLKWEFLRIFFNKKVIVLKNYIPATEVLDHVAGTIVVNSSVGLEAFKKKKKFVVIGSWVFTKLKSFTYYNVLFRKDMEAMVTYLADETPFENPHYEEDINRLKNASYAGTLSKCESDIDYDLIARSVFEKTQFLEKSAATF
jgi:hypothetical protein